MSTPPNDSATALFSTLPWIWSTDDLATFLSATSRLSVGSVVKERHPSPVCKRGLFDSGTLD